MSDKYSVADVLEHIRKLESHPHAFKRGPNMLSNPYRAGRAYYCIECGQTESFVAHSDRLREHRAI